MSVSQQTSGFNYQIPPRYTIKNVTDDYSNSGYIVTSADYGSVLAFKQTTSIYVSLPPASSVGVGFNFWVWNSTTSAANLVNVVTVNPVKVDGINTIQIAKNQGFQFVSDGTNWQTGTPKAYRMYSEASGNSRALANGESSIAIGSSVTATGVGSVSIGSGGTYTNGNNSYALGFSCGTSIDYAVAIGYGNTANQYYSLALGNSSTVNTIGKTAFGSPGSASNAQWGILSLFAATTSNAATVLTSDSLTAATNNQLIVPSSTAISFLILVVARQQAAGGTSSAAWQVTGLIRREALASTTTLVGTPTVTAISNTPAWTLAVAADTTRGALTVRGTGATSTNINWLATVYSSEMTYA